MKGIYTNKNTKASTENMVEALRWFVEENADVAIKALDSKRIITKYEWKHGNKKDEEYLKANYEAHK